jgi:hypothetical protein
MMRAFGMTKILIGAEEAAAWPERSVPALTSLRPTASWCGRSRHLTIPARQQQQRC